ncbi:MAG: hypothetical protein IPQ05_12550 [Leptospiraceae bacterium]|nr:hypothetical protein [Leptospiraceae bacterium]MBK9501137.1 hypothetical protein [Leptospiraceae bacterium]MBL0264673.1 hypothetical protein [Leptospiraceae bacterium]
MMKFPQCTSCKHLDRSTLPSNKSFACKAFPNGIPFEVWDNKHNHTQTYSGDNGIMFEKDYADDSVIDIHELVYLLREENKRSWISAIFFLCALSVLCGLFLLLY